MHRIRPQLIGKLYAQLSKPACRSVSGARPCMIGNPGYHILVHIVFIYRREQINHDYDFFQGQYTYSVPSVRVRSVNRIYLLVNK